MSIVIQNMTMAKKEFTTMIKINVVDYLIENLVENPRDVDNHFCLSLAVFYSLNKENLDDLELDDMDYFNIIVGSESGLSSYFKKILDASGDKMVYFPHIAITEKFNKELICQSVKMKVESIVAKSERQLIANALIYFDWQYQDDLTEMTRLFG